MATGITKSVIITRITEKIKFLALGTLFLSLFSCDPAMVYDQWKDIEGMTWSKDSSAVFKPVVNDSLTAMNLVIGVRNTNDYNFSNLWCFVTIISPDSALYKDTVDLSLASPHGKWYGKGWGNTFTSLHYFRQNYSFALGGTYEIKLEHGMRQEQLEGVQALGFRIEKAEK